jgi:membrane-associated phospholipid phosphatase
VLGASLLDKKVDRWALNHSAGSSVAKLGNAVPLLLGLGALADLSGGGVGWTALQSAGFAFTANSALRVGLGRARPSEDRGNRAFDPLTAQGISSSFPSNHTAVAFALATPFAQTYDMPWLYAVAGLTGLGRVQSRQHWLSDTVAGGVLGYAIGSVMSDEHKQNVLNNKSGRQLLLSPNGVAAKWWWE